MQKWKILRIVLKKYEVINLLKDFKFSVLTLRFQTYYLYLSLISAGTLYLELNLFYKVQLECFITSKYSYLTISIINIYIEVISWVDLYMIFIHECGCDICHE